MKNRIVSVIACSLFCFGARAEAQEVKYKSVADFIQTVGGAKQILMQTDADVNRDKLQDWVCIVTSGESNKTDQLFILLQTRDNAFVVAAKSARSAASLRGNYYVEDLSVRRDSVFVAVNYKSGGEITSRTVQFKLVNQRWRLIGSRTFDLNLDKDLSTETQTNFLTGASAVTTQKGDEKPRAKRFKSKRAAKYLEDYDLYDAADVQ